MNFNEKIATALEAAKSGARDEFDVLTKLLRDEIDASERDQLLSHEEAIIQRVGIILVCEEKRAELPKVFHDFLKHSDENLREDLARNLSLSPESTPAIDFAIALLKDDSHNVRYHAIEAVVKIDSSHLDLIPLLKNDDSWSIRQKVAQSLECDKNYDLLPIFFDVLVNDSDSDVQESVAKGLNAYFANADEWPASVERPDIATLNKALDELGDAGSVPELKSWLKGCCESEFNESFLDSMGTVLTKKDNLKTLPRAWYSEDTTSSIFDLLTNDAPRAVVLIGDSGTGKTAIVNELAHRLAAEDSPWCLIQMTPADFLAGTKYLGEWQTRLSELINAISNPKRVILYVPSIHELATTGKSSSSEENIASSIASYIERGQISILGESTEQQLQEGLSSQPGFRRLLQPVRLQPADDKLTGKIVEKVLALEGMVPTPEFTKQLLELSEFSEAETRNPGRAISLLRLVLSQRKKMPPQEQARLPSNQEILSAIERATGVSTDLLDDQKPLSLKDARAFFAERVIGQPEAVNAAVDLITVIKSRLSDPSKPFGVMLFVGPTGVGKTELARSLAEYCFGDANRLSRLDMSEFATYESFERLNGGRGQSGVLTSIVRKQPFSIILLDEIEKAHINVYDLCLQIFDAGRLTDGQGRSVDFRRSIIIMTSNVGSRMSELKSVGFGGTEGSDGNLATQIHRELSHTFRPEFLNRIDRVVSFRPLTEDTAERIARLEVSKMLQRNGITSRRLIVDVDPNVYPYLLKEGYSRTFGARPLKRAIERLVLLPMARQIASGNVPPESVLRLTAKQTQIVVEVTKSAEHQVSKKSPQSAEVIALQELEQRIEKLSEENLHLSARKSLLLTQTSTPGFWDNREEAAKVSDQIYRIESVIKQLEWLHHTVNRMTETPLSHDDLSYLSLRVQLLEMVTLDTEAPLVGDVFIVITCLSKRGQVLNGLNTLKEMYLKFAKRFRLQTEILGGLTAEVTAESTDNETIMIRVNGVGATALLLEEIGIHEIHRKGDSAKGKEKDREVFRIDIYPVDSHEEPLPENEISFKVTQPRLAANSSPNKQTWSIRLMHKPTLVSIHTFAEGNKDELKDRLVPLLESRVQNFQKGNEADKQNTIRIYELGQSGVVKDRRTGERSGRVEQVFQGYLERFIILPSETDSTHQIKKEESKKNRSKKA